MYILSTWNHCPNTLFKLILVYILHLWETKLGKSSMPCTCARKKCFVI